jgi:2-amino-4-hydroxy-6-hydroxymethyldihydropteridine diphosphokinase
MESNQVVLSLGGNLGNPIQTQQKAIQLISGLEGVDLIRMSAFYESLPWGFESQHKFINSAVLISCLLKPLDLLDALKEIEVLLGRKYKNNQVGYESREIDIDIIYYGDMTLENKSLIIPHPSMRERYFVLCPMADICPDFLHPVTGDSVSQLIEKLSLTENEMPVKI